jgi:hypothetical protein
LGIFFIFIFIVFSSFFLTVEEQQHPWWCGCGWVVLGWFFDLVLGLTVGCDLKRLEKTQKD